MTKLTLGQVVFFHSEGYTPHGFETTGKVIRVEKNKAVIQQSLSRIRVPNPFIDGYQFYSRNRMWQLLTHPYNPPPLSPQQQIDRVLKQIGKLPAHLKPGNIVLLNRDLNNLLKPYTQLLDL